MTSFHKTGGIEQYLTFTLEDDLFASSVLKIKEVLELPRIRKVPNTPEFVAGIINLRGTIVPVIDLRKKLKYTARAYTPETTIIIFEVEHDEDTVQIGALVDSIKLVRKIGLDQMKQPPEAGISINTEYISSITENENQDDLILVLNIDKVFSKKELTFFTENDLSVYEEEMVDEGT